MTRRELNRGFSLLELLLVVAIIGVLGAIATPTFRRSTDAARLNEAAAQIAADLQRVRSSAQRTNQNATFALTSGSPQRYTLTISGVSTTRTLPTNVQVATTPAPLTLTYFAPFGERERAGTPAPTARLDLTLRNRTLPPRYVKVVGVTGKVYVSERP